MPMRSRLSLGVVLVSLALSPMVYAQEVRLGFSVEGLLHAAKERNPEIASMRFDADGADRIDAGHRSGRSVPVAW